MHPCILRNSPHTNSYVQEFVKFFVLVRRDSHYNASVRRPELYLNPGLDPATIPAV